MGLTGFRGLGLEAIDEVLQPLALVGLSLGVLGIEHFARRPLFLERRVGAFVERQLAAIEVQDLVDRGVEQVAVMADDDHGARIIRQMVFQPERAFEVEIVGRLVEQQQVGRRKQRRGERDAHPPTARKLRAGSRLIGSGKSEAAENRGGPGRGGMGVDIHEPGLNVGDPDRIMRGVGFTQQGLALKVGLQHDRDKAFRAVGGFLGETADAPSWRDGDGAGLGRQLAADRVKQGRFADTVAADEADPRAGDDLH